MNTSVLQMSQLDTLWVLIAACLVFSMQAGFLCLEAGLSRAKHSMNVATKNIVDYTVASIAFFLVGYGFLFGKSWNGIIGTTDFFFREAFPGQAVFLIFQLMFCATAATIVSGAVAERMKFKAYLLYSIFISLLLYPLFGHWVWGGIFYTDQAGWLERLGYLDFAGASVVHQIGGWMALAGITVLGARQGKFDIHGCAKRLLGHNIPLALLGVFILWFGWFGFNGGSTLAMNQDVGPVILNTNLSGATGALICFLIGWFYRRRPDILDLANGALGGLVAITASAGFVETPAALVIGSVAGGVVFLGTEWLERGLKLDDVVGAVPVHAFCGVWGVLAVGFFSRPEALLYPDNRLYHFGIQALGCGACFVLAFGGGWVFFRILNGVMGGIRVSPEAENLGLNVFEHKAASELTKLQDAMHDIACSQDWSKRTHTDPFSDVGELGGHFNMLLGTAQHVMEELAQKHQVLLEGKKELEALNQKVTRRTGELETVKQGLEIEVQRRTKDLVRAQKTLKKKVQELEQFHHITVGRELDMMKLKGEMNHLLVKLGRPARYQAQTKNGQVTGSQHALNEALKKDRSSQDSQTGEKAP